MTLSEQVLNYSRDGMERMIVLRELYFISGCGSSHKYIDPSRVMVNYIWWINLGEVCDKMSYWQPDGPQSQVVGFLNVGLKWIPQ